MLDPSLEVVVVEQVKQELQVETVFPKGVVNGRQPLVPALQCCLLQLALPGRLPRFLPSEDVYTGVYRTRSGGVAVGVEFKITMVFAPRDEGWIGARAIDEVVSIHK